MNTLLEERPAPGSRRWSALNLRAIPSWVRYPVLVYLGARLLYLLVAVVDTRVQHVTLQSALSNWDGVWYLRVSYFWYPHHVPQVVPGHHAYSDLGFLPVYPMAIWLVAQIPVLSHYGAALAISLITGGIATVNMARLAADWWDEQASRRAILFLCFFPGTVVFSMAYSEGLMLALVTTSLLALQRRRWVTAGLCAALATGIVPVAVAIVLACLSAALVEARRHGFTNRESMRSYVALILSPLGLIGFGIFLWFWVGTPLASYIAQSRSWSESTTPLAVPRMVGSLIGQIFLGNSIGKHGPGVDLDDISGVIGAIVMVYGLARLWVERHRFPVPALVWTAVVSFLALTSNKTPPNPRLLLCAFPILLLIGAETRSRRGRIILMTVSVLLLIVMSYFTFVGEWLRP